MNHQPDQIKPPPSSLPVNKRNKQTKRTNSSNTQSNHHRNEQQRRQRKEQKTSWSKSSNKQRPIQRKDRRRSKTIQPQRLKPRTKTGSNHYLENGGDRRRKPRKRMKTEMERVQTKKGEDRWCGEGISSHHRIKQSTSERTALDFGGEDKSVKG